MVALVGVLALAFVSSPARADEAAAALLAEARREKEALQYARALELLDRALAAGGSRPAAVVEIVKMAAEVAAGLDQPERAQRSFERLLVLQPDASYPAGTSPKIAEPFSAARRALGGRALAVRHEVPRALPRRVVLVVDADPLGWVRGATARYATRTGRTGVARAAGQGRIVVPLPDDTATLVLAAIDEHGNELVVHGSAEAPIAVAGADLVPPPSSRARARRPAWARWYWWAGGTALLASASSIFGVLALSTQDDLDARNRASEGLAYEDTLSLERRGQRQALVANIGFVVTGVTAITGTLVLALAPTTTE